MAVNICPGDIRTHHAKMSPYLSSCCTRQHGNIGADTSSLFLVVLHMELLCLLTSIKHLERYCSLKLSISPCLTQCKFGNLACSIQGETVHNNNGARQPPSGNLALHGKLPSCSASFAWEGNAKESYQLSRSRQSDKFIWIHEYA